MRSEFSEERNQNQFVEEIGQSVANELFGYSTGNENQASNNQEDINSLRPKRKTRKIQQVNTFYDDNYIRKDLF